MLQIGQIAPDFTADTTDGPIRFHEWIGDNWAVLFSHPKTFTPVCTTELGSVARLQPEFAKRHTKVIGLSVDPVEAHERWAVDIERTQGTRPDFPMIGDADLTVSKLYNMLPADEAGTSDGRTAANNATVRTVFIIGPDKRVKLVDRPGGRTGDERLHTRKFHLTIGLRQIGFVEVQHDEQRFRGEKLKTAQTLCVVWREFQRAKRRARTPAFA